MPVKGKELRIGNLITCSSVFTYCVLNEDYYVIMSHFMEIISIMKSLVELLCDLSVLYTECK